MKSPKTLQAKIQLGTANIQKAQQEVIQLLQELNAGTLNRNTLEAGLQSLQQYVTQVADHIPTFANEIGGGQ